jgi:hypothetical protein
VACQPDRPGEGIKPLSGTVTCKHDLDLCLAAVAREGGHVRVRARAEVEGARLPPDVGEALVQPRWPCVRSRR